MNLLLKGELRALRAQPLSSTFIVLSLGIAVASVSLTHHLSLDIVERFGELAIQGDYDHVIELETKQESEYFNIVKRWQKGELIGVSHVVPVIQGSVSHRGQVVNLFGFDPIAAGNSLQIGGITVAGSRSSFLVSDTVIASGLDVQEGDFIGPARVLSVSDSTNPYLTADIPTAQKLMQQPNQIHSVWLRSDDQANHWWDNLLPGLLTAANFTLATPELSGYEVQPFDWWNPSRTMGDAIVFNLAMLSLLTLLVAGFIIVQTLQTNIRNREQQLRVLDTLGISDLEKRTLILAQCLAYGLVGSAVGFVLSVGLLALFTDQSLLSAAGSINPIGVIKGIALAVVATLLAGLLVGASGLTPNRMSKVVLGVLTAVLALWCFQHNSGLLGASLMSLCLCIAHVLVVAPLFTRMVVKGVSVIPIRSLRLQMVLRSSFESTAYIRTAINALSIAVATAIGIGLMLASFRSEFLLLLDQRLSIDLHLSNASQIKIEELLTLEGVEKVSAYRRGEGQINQFPFDIVGANIDVDEAVRYGHSESLVDSVLINETSALRYGLSEGEVGHLRVAGQEDEEVSIARVFKDYGEPRARVIVPNSLLPTSRLIQDRYSIKTQQPNAVKQAIGQKFPEVQVIDNQSVREIAVRIFNTSFASTQIMVHIAILVAVFGIACALIGMQTRRLRDMQVLTLLGTNRSSLVADVFAHNLVIGLLAVLAALPLGVAIAWNLCYQVNPRAYGWTFDLGWSTTAVLLPSLLGIVAAVLAGLEPLRRVIVRLVNEPLPTTT